MMGERPAKDSDCYFYYYSSCSKGAACPYRHEPAALRNETVCVYWLAGKCCKEKCIFRHMEITKPRDRIACYFETQPGGCRKPHCPFQHTSIKTADDDLKVDGVILPVKPGDEATTPTSTTVKPTTPVPTPKTSVIVALHDGESDAESNVGSPLKEPSNSTHTSLDATPRESPYREEEIKRLRQIQAQEAGLLGYTLSQEGEEDEEQVVTQKKKEDEEEEEEEEDEEVILQEVIVEEEVDQWDATHRRVSANQDLRLLLSRKLPNEDLRSHLQGTNGRTGAVGLADTATSDRPAPQGYKRQNTDVLGNNKRRKALKHRLGNMNNNVDDEDNKQHNTEDYKRHETTEYKGQNDTEPEEKQVPEIYKRLNQGRTIWMPQDEPTGEYKRHDTSEYKRQNDTEPEQKQVPEIYKRLNQGRTVWLPQDEEAGNKRHEENGSHTHNKRKKIQDRLGAAENNKRHSPGLAGRALLAAIGRPQTKTPDDDDDTVTSSKGARSKVTARLGDVKARLGKTATSSSSSSSPSSSSSSANVTSSSLDFEVKSLAEIRAMKRKTATSRITPISVTSPMKVTPKVARVTPKITPEKVTPKITPEKVTPKITPIRVTPDLAPTAKLTPEKASSPLKLTQKVTPPGKTTPDLPSKAKITLRKASPKVTTPGKFTLNFTPPAKTTPDFTLGNTTSKASPSNPQTKASLQGHSAISHATAKSGQSGVTSSSNSSALTSSKTPVTPSLTFDLEEELLLAGETLELDEEINEDDLLL